MKKNHSLQRKESVCRERIRPALRRTAKFFTRAVFLSNMQCVSSSEHGLNRRVFPADKGQLRVFAATSPRNRANDQAFACIASRPDR